MPGIWPIVVVLFVCQIQVNYTAVITANYHKPAHPGRCTLPEFDMILRPGKKAPYPVECGEIMCLNRKGDAQIKTCQEGDVPLGCEKFEALHPNAPYPACCEYRIECPSDEDYFKKN